MNLDVKPRIKLNNNIYIVFINELNNYMNIFMESIFNKSRKKWLGIKLTYLTEAIALINRTCLFSS